jgi:hypothetical protein
VIELIRVQEPEVTETLVPGRPALKLGVGVEVETVPFSGALISGAVELSLHAASSIAVQVAAETRWRMGQSPE